MPANLTPEAADKWALVEAARNPSEKIIRMQEFLSVVPKHKGTMKIRGRIKKKMALLRKEIEERKQKRSGRGGPKLFIEQEGAAQVALLGLTNVGKSCLLSVVTNADIAVSPVPYTTRKPSPGVLNFEDMQLQLVETPALMDGSAGGRAGGLLSIGVARNADGIILMVDLSYDPISQLNLILSELEKARVLINKPKGRVIIDRRYMGAGLRVILVGKILDGNVRDVESLLRSYRIGDALVKIIGEVSLEDVEDSIFESTVYRPAVIIANKIDAKSAPKNLTQLEKFVSGRIPIIPVSCESKQGLVNIGRVLFETLDLIRIYTKEPGARKHTNRPFTLQRGATVAELAKSIHTDFQKDFAFARVWSNRLKFSPRKVGLSFLLEDGDIIELHTN